VKRGDHLLLVERPVLASVDQLASPDLSATETGPQLAVERLVLSPGERSLARQILARIAGGLDAAGSGGVVTVVILNVGPEAVELGGDRDTGDL
jgi:hypothetical protein